MRLQAIRQLGSLQIFVDEAHHSYGKTLEGTLKKTRQTIDYLHKHTPLISVVNLTGTPYVNNKMIAIVDTMGPIELSEKQDRQIERLLIVNKAKKATQKAPA